jgi:uncharacterized repeat protein (TIGR01451 family)
MTSASAAQTIIFDRKINQAHKEGVMKQEGMMKKGILVAVAAMLLAPAAVWAQQKKGGIEIKTVSEVDVVGTNAKGEKEAKRLEAGKVGAVPGDVVIYTTTFINREGKPAENVVIKNPVPQHMSYVDKSAEGAGTKIEFSIDDGKSYGAPEALTVTDAQGRKRPAKAEDYTHIRWRVLKALEPGAKGTVSFKAKVK